MAIEFRCSQCEKMLRVSEKHAGLAARCPHCLARMTVPQVGGNPEPAFSDAENSRADAARGASTTTATISSAETSPPNPYAAPLATAPVTVPARPGTRAGLPWDNERPGIGAWFRTVSLIVRSPSLAFEVMRQSGGFGKPLAFHLIGVGLPVLVVSLLISAGVLILYAIISSNVPDPKAPANGTALTVTLFLSILIYGGLTICIFSFFGTFIGGAIVHLPLRFIGTKQPFETTFRVMAYVQGALAWSILIPCPYLNVTIMSVWMAIILPPALARAHELPTKTVAMALGICILATCGFGVAISGCMAVISAIQEQLAN